MPSVEYKATVSDGAGRKREFFEISVELTFQELTAFQDAGSSDHPSSNENAGAAVNTILCAAKYAIFPAEPWMCHCGCRANRIAHVPRIRQYSDGRVSVADSVEMHCNKVDCKIRVMRTTEEKYQQETKKITDLPTAETFALHKLQDLRHYCSRACQVAHWKAVHKRECQPC